MGLKIKNSDFLTAAVKPKGYPPVGPPEIAFAGRSNVGKSSLINCLLQRKRLVRVSSKPGRTQEINFFAINQDQFRLVDLPGYGFAKVPHSVKMGWRHMVESYLSAREPLVCVVLILDIRREPTDEDFMLLDYLAAQHLTTVLVVTKADKLSNNKRNARLAKLRPVLGKYDPDFMPVSAVNGMGREKLLDRLGMLAGFSEQSF
jgi:GTP-binding protein